MTCSIPRSRLVRSGELLTISGFSAGNGLYLVTEVRQTEDPAAPFAYDLLGDPENAP